mgnify:FL=1
MLPLWQNKTLSPYIAMADYKVSSHDQVKIIEIAGRIDPADWKQLKETLDQVTQDPKSFVVIDLSQLTYIASSGFRELFLAARKVKRAEGDMAVCGLQGEIKRVFDLAGVGAALSVYDDQAAAVAALKAGA